MNPYEKLFKMRDFILGLNGIHPIKELIDLLSKENIGLSPITMDGILKLWEKYEFNRYKYT